MAGLDFNEMTTLNVDRARSNHTNTYNDPDYVHVGDDGTDLEGMKEDVSLQNRSGLGTMLAKGVGAVGSGLVGYFRGRPESQSPEAAGAENVIDSQPRGTKQEQLVGFIEHIQAI